MSSTFRTVMGATECLGPPAGIQHQYHRECSGGAALGSFTYGGNSAQNLPDMQLVQDCCLACRIQPQHDHLSRDTTPQPSLQHPKGNTPRSTAGRWSHPHLLVPKDFIEHLPEGVPHQLQ